MDFPTLYALTDAELIDELVYIQVWLNTYRLGLSPAQLVKASDTIYDYKGPVVWPGEKNNDIPVEISGVASVEKWHRSYKKESADTLELSELNKRPAFIKKGAVAFDRIRKFDLYDQIRPIYRAHKLSLLQTRGLQKDIKISI